MDNSDGGYGGAANNSAAVELTGKIMVVAIIVLFLVVVFVLFLHLYAKWFWWRVEEATVPSREARNPPRRRFVFVSGQDPSAAASVRTGLDPSVLRSLPVLIFNPEDFKEGLECAVCLSELAPAEKARLLPKCNHGFHVECIDMWLQSHSTCPICRNPVAPPHCSIPIGVDSDDSDSNSAGENSTLHSVEESSNSDSNLSNESLNFPTNVLFWGNDTQVSSRGAGLEDGPSSQSNRPSSSIASTNLRPDGMLAIDIPRQAGESSSLEEELKSPITTRLRSLKRLLSKEKRVAPCSSSCVEAEQLGRNQNS